MNIRPEIIITQDGSHSLRHPVLGDTYHSLNGALAESEHVFINNGFNMCGKSHLRVFEMGFGSGLNALLTLRAAEKAGRTVEYTAIELYPVDPDTARLLNYSDDPLFMMMHEAEWEVPEKITPFFTLEKKRSDLVGLELDAIFDLVYFDAFAPDTQPGLWSPDIFRSLFAALDIRGIVVTYSSKGDVKRALRSVGFEVERLPGAPGKRHMLRATKTSIK